MKAEWIKMNHKYDDLYNNSNHNNNNEQTFLNTVIINLCISYVYRSLQKFSLHLSLQNHTTILIETEILLVCVWQYV